MTIRNLSAFVLLVSVVALAACAGETPVGEQGQQPAAQQAAPPAEQAKPVAVAEHMKQHFTQVSAVRDAVVMNNEKAAQEAANWIIEHQEVAGLPPGWPAHVENMRSAARDALNAKGVDEAGLAVGRMTRVCAECHQATGAKLSAPEPGAAPTVAENAESHMLRHQWAIEQMWTGLIYPSEGAWRRGADALAFAALKPEQLVRDRGAATADIGKLAIQVHSLAAEGTAARSWDDRAQVYGKLLGTCIRCHQQLKVTK